MKIITTFLLAFLLAAATLSAAVRPESGGTLHAELKGTKGKGKGNNNNNNGDVGGKANGMGGFFGPGGGFGMPGFGNGNGWGNGGSIGGGPTVVCSDPGPCYKKKVACPTNCFTSYSRSGKNYGAGGGGGGCTIDCKKKCTAYC
ncbi:TPA_asm: hypothetical protein HUJ06_031904 [Nelumbo nucifera]|uniref:Uncharacterized protein n=1 Tax=Nelumbo nucifera TaxID=4432 RepID=A0A823A5I7_NELNU|nr:TPA_asm: hypothetical protein HUJ06_031904 [Nelumbo nucifera]